MRVSIDGIPYKSLCEAVETVFGTFMGCRHPGAPGAKYRSEGRLVSGEIKVKTRPLPLSLKKVAKWCRAEKMVFAVERKGVWRKYE